MTSTQLEFGIRTSARVTNVHLVGSWDNYQRQLPLKSDTRRRDGAWRGIFKFQGSCIVPGSRYWYYYVLDGYQVVHDPSKLATVEPTTGRTLNILDVPAAVSDAPVCSRVPPRAAAAPQSRPARLSIDVNIVRGRALSPSKIVSPKPLKPHESRRIINGDYSNDGDWIDKFDRLNMVSRSSHRSTATSIADSDVPSLTLSRSSDNSSPTSISSSSSGVCVCQRFGITRSGHRVKLDCGGTLCGSSDDSSSCSDEDDLSATPEPCQNVHLQPQRLQAQPTLPKLTVQTNSVSVNNIISPLATTPLRFGPEQLSSTGKSPLQYSVPLPQHPHMALHRQGY